MSLTGAPFLALVVALTVAAFVGAVLLMPRISGTGPRPVAGRVGLLILTNAFVVLTSAVLLNNEYSFFADWTDIKGALLGGKPHVTTAHAGAQPVGLDGPEDPPSLPDPAAQTVMPTLPAGGGTGRTRSFTVTGTHSGLTGQILIVLPADYFEAANATRRYPILETFSGYPAAPSQWPDGMHLTSTYDGVVDRHAVAPAITISPTIEFPGGVDTECVDGPDRKVETWITQDVPAWVTEHLRASPAPTGWATIGISSGAWCAAMATMLHPEQYGAAIVLGGYFSPQFASSFHPFGPGTPAATRYDLVGLASRAPPPVALWVHTSKADGVSWPSTSALLATARPPLSVDAVVLEHAGHRASIWMDALPGALEWLGTSIPGFSPQTS